ncbi:MAG: hypothetical protein JSS14_23255 [Proteobacteria bacterium]|nr:hypothetical protein [Pseudomonadota bacterium]
MTMKLRATLVAACAALLASHAIAEIFTAGVASFQMGADSKTGQVNRCGLEFSVFRVVGTNKSDAVVAGVNGSVFVNRSGVDKFFGSTKLALLRKEPKDQAFKTSAARTWWLKAPSKPALVPYGGSPVPAENHPYKLAGAEYVGTMEVLGSIIGGEELKIYYEPADGGAQTLSAVLEVEGDGAKQLVACLQELMAE